MMAAEDVARVQAGMPAPGAVYRPALVAVISPCWAPDEARWKIHESYCRAAMRDCLGRGEYPFASHMMLAFSSVLDDRAALDRRLGMDCGAAWEAAALYLAVYADLGWSDGMRGSEAAARARGQQVIERRLGGMWAGRP